MIALPMAHGFLGDLPTDREFSCPPLNFASPVKVVLLRRLHLDSAGGVAAIPGSRESGCSLCDPK